MGVRLETKTKNHKEFYLHRKGELKKKKLAEKAAEKLVGLVLVLVGGKKVFKNMWLRASLCARMWPEFMLSTCLKRLHAVKLTCF